MEILDLLVAQPLDVEAFPADEQFQVLLPLVRTGELARAAAHHAFLARGIGLAHDGRRQLARAHGREGKGARIGRPPLRHEPQHLRDDIAGALHDHRVTDHDAEPLDLLGIVQRRILHHHAADRDRRKPGDRRQRAGPPHLDVDGVQRRHGLFGRELVGNRPARRTRHEAEPALQGKVVHLVDDTVNVIGQVRPLPLDPVIMRQKAFRAVEYRHQRIGDKSVSIQ